MTDTTSMSEAFDRAGRKRPLKIAEELARAAVRDSGGDFERAFALFRAELYALTADVMGAALGERNEYRCLMDFLGAQAGVLREEKRGQVLGETRTTAAARGAGHNKSGTHGKPARPNNSGPTDIERQAAVDVSRRLSNSILSTMLVNGQPLYAVTKRELLASATADDRNSRFKRRLAEYITLDSQTVGQCVRADEANELYDAITEEVQRGAQ